MKLKPTPDQTITLKSPREIEIMREAGRIVAGIVLELKRAARPGMTTAELDRIAADLMKRHDAV